MKSLDGKMTMILKLSFDFICCIEPIAVNLLKIYQTEAPPLGLSLLFLQYMK